LLGFDADGKTLEFNGYAKGYPFVFEEPQLVNEFSSEAMDLEKRGVPIGCIGINPIRLIEDIAIAFGILFAV